MKLIDLTGQQHFMHCETWQTEKQFHDLQQRDAYKNEWCRLNNIPLIRIPYTHTKLNINDLRLSTTNFLVKERNDVQW